MTVALKSPRSGIKLKSRQAPAAISSKVTPLVRPERNTLAPRSLVQAGKSPVGVVDTGGTRPERKYSRRELRSRRNTPVVGNGLADRNVSSANPSLNQSGDRTQTNPWEMPFWLRSLLKAQSIFSLVTLLLVVGALGIYGSTVYYQQQWGVSYRKLENLRRQERQLTAANETLKKELAREAEDPANGLVLPTSEHVLFLDPTPPTSSAEVESFANQATAPEPTYAQKPVGY